MKLTTPMHITAADSDSRTITGRIVAFNEFANASTGKVVFARGSIQPQDVFLNLEHDNTRRIGKSIAMSVNDKEMTATFKIANTTAGTDALTEAMEGLRDGFSIELAVDNYEMQKDGTMKVLNGELTAVALVTEPAVRSARVSEVAASQDSETETVADTTNPNEGDKVENTTEQVTAPAVEPVAAPDVAPVQASRPAYYTAPRSPIVDKVSYLEHYLKASILHDEDSRQYVKAADNTTSTAPGMIPTPQSTNVINALANADRGMIDAISRESLVSEGMTFEIPKISAVPVVDQIDEGDAIAESSLSATFLSVSVKPFKGRAISTVELIDRSRPEYLTALLQNLEFAYAKETDLYVTGAIQAAANTTAQAANTAAGFLGYTSKAVANVYGASLGFARSLVVSPTQWGNIMGYNDNGAPLYNAANPSNQAGSVGNGSLRGVVSPGLNLHVSRSIGVAGSTTAEGDLSMVVINPDSYTWYESPRFTLRTNVNSDGTIDILYYGYGALATKVANGATWNNLA
jgi:phage head maturation protease